jgi:hypothetical protein
MCWVSGSRWTRHPFGDAVLVRGSSSSVPGQQGSSSTCRTSLSIPLGPVVLPGFVPQHT